MAEKRQEGRVQAPDRQPETSLQRKLGYRQEKRKTV